MQQHGSTTLAAEQCDQAIVPGVAVGSPIFSRAPQFRFVESEEHGGEVVARHRDGRNLYFRSYPDLYAGLAESRIGVDDVLIEEVARAGEADAFL